MKTKKYYSFNNLAGCVVQSKSRKTKVLVGLYEGTQSGLASDMPWLIVCEEHSSCVGHYSLNAAKQAMSDTTIWCEKCQENQKT